MHRLYADEISVGYNPTNGRPGSSRLVIQTADMDAYLPAAVWIISREG